MVLSIANFIVSLGICKASASAPSEIPLMIIVLFNSQNSRATLATQKASISATCAQVSSLNFLHFSSSSINSSHVAQIQFS
jgi:hypothetical protein